MPVENNEIEYRYSGGAANATPLLSIGGAISSVVAAAALFDTVDNSEAVAGDAEYRLVYIKNTDGADAAANLKVWIEANTPGAESTIDIGLAVAAVNGTETAIANENTAPSGVTFSAPTNYAGGLSIAGMVAGAYKGLWIRRTITAGAEDASETFKLRTGWD